MLWIGIMPLLIDLFISFSRCTIPVEVFKNEKIQRSHGSRHAGTVPRHQTTVPTVVL